MDYKRIVSFLFSCTGVAAMVIAASILLPLSFMGCGIRYPAARKMARFLLFALGVRVRLEGKFPEGGPFVVMANHSSFIDPFLTASVVQGKFTGVVAQYNYKYPIWGTVLKRYRAISIDRGNRSHSVQGIRQAEEVIHQKGYHVVILPEGTRTLTGKMGPLKKGGFHLAINTGTPVLPIGIEGAYRFKPKNRKIMMPGPVTIRFGSPIPTGDGNSKDQMKTLMSQTEEQLLRLSGEAIS